MSKTRLPLVRSRGAARAGIVIACTSALCGCIGEPTRFTYSFARTAAAQGPEDEAKTACRYEATKHSAAVRNDTDRFVRYSDIFVACMKTKGFSVTRKLVV